MAGYDCTWVERRRRIAMRPDAHLHIRHDAWRFMPPGSPRYSGRDVVKYFWPEPSGTDNRGTSGFNPAVDIKARELNELRFLLAQLRLELTLQQFAFGSRKYSPNQPRVPAGSPEGGRWTNDTGAPTSASTTDNVQTIYDRSGEQTWKIVRNEYRPDGSLGRQTIVNRDGSIIHSEFSASPQADGWNERHTVTLPDGSVTTFQNSGLTQTVLDKDGRQIAASTWTSDGPEPEALVQQAFLAPPHPVVMAATALYAWMSSQNGPDSTAVFAYKAAEFVPGPTLDVPTLYVRALTRDEVDEACPRHSEVQSITNQVTASTERGAYPSAQNYGTAIHQKIKEEINGPTTDPPSPPRDLDFRAEVSIIKSERASYGQKGSVRIDVFENPGTGTVCVYDIKTGERGLSLARMHELAQSVSLIYPGTTRIIVTEVRAGR